MLVVYQRSAFETFHADHRESFETFHADHRESFETFHADHRESFIRYCPFFRYKRSYVKQVAVLITNTEHSVVDPRGTQDVVQEAANDGIEIFVFGE